MERVDHRDFLRVDIGKSDPLRPQASGLGRKSIRQSQCSRKTEARCFTNARRHCVA
ncbi:hypothetical protein [Lysobacter gummosus]|uniref:hypothetical protein n=1 Tax=Lysobacter gummosus TaxID=262324 RepID=UPI003625436A